MMIEDELRKQFDEIKGYFDNKDYTHSKTLADRAVNELFFVSSDQLQLTKNTPLLERLSAIAPENTGAIARLLSASFQLLDYYSRLHRFQDASDDPWAPTKVLEQVQLLFPGHLASKVAHGVICNDSSDLTISEAWQKYGNKDFLSYDENNLDGKINDPAKTFVDYIVSNRDLAPENGLVQYVMAACYFLNIDCPSEDLHQIISKNSSCLGDRKVIYESVMKRLEDQTRERLRRMISDFAGHYYKENSDNDSIHEILKGIKIQHDNDQNTILGFATQLLGLILSLDPETVFLADYKEIELNKFEAFKEMVDKARTNLNEYLNNDSVNAKYRDLGSLKEALQTQGVPLPALAKGFFEMLGIRSKQKPNEKLEGLVGYAATDIPEWAKDFENGYPDEIRRGVHKVVFIGYNPSMGQRIAAKGIMDLDRLTDNPGVEEYFKKLGKSPKEAIIQEGKNMLKLRGCKNIVEIFYAQPYGNIFVIKEAAFKYSLEDELKVAEKEGKLLPLKRTLGIMIQAVNGLCELNLKMLHHGDPKPSNLGFMEDGEAVWTDFGVCSYIGAELGREGEREYVSHILTMPPEMLKGYEHAVANSEVWSMGMILYRIEFGEYPIPTGLKEDYEAFIKSRDFKEKERIRMELLRLLSNKEYITSVHSDIRASGVNPQLQEIMIGCFAPDPYQREYRSPQELKQALEAVHDSL